MADNATLPAQTNGRATSLSAYDREIGRVVAGLLDGELERRQPMTVIRWFSQELGVPADGLMQRGRALSGLNLQITGLAIAELLPRASAVADHAGEGPPMWSTLDVPGGALELPFSLRASFPAGAVADVAFGLTLEPKDGYHQLMLATAREQRIRVFRAFDEAVASFATGPDNPFRGRVLEVSETNHGLDLDLATTPEGDRDSLVIPEWVWQEIDHNVHGVLRHADLLRAAGLGLNRGLLLHGPPGTGKTALCRVVAAEVTGQAATLFVEPRAMQSHLGDVYRLASRLAPCLVVLEDIDMAVGRRDRGNSAALLDFLVAVDGAMTEHEGVITIATTNSPQALDDAATRAARFDRIIEVPRPSRPGREAIWRRYLVALGAERFDVGRLARATSGATGADIRELVRHAILLHGSAVDTQVLLELASEARRGWVVADGHYL